LSSARKARANTPSRSSRGRPRGPAAARLRILFLASQFPYPPDSGAAIKTLSIFDYLRARHDVRLVAFTSSPLTEEQNQWAGSIGGATTLQMNKGRNPLNLVRSYVSRIPISIERNRSAQMRALVQREVAEEAPDVVFVDGWLMAQYLPEGYDGAKILHEHNAEYQLWERQVKSSNGPLSWVTGREASRVRKYEAGVLPRFDTVFVVSDEDRRALRQLGAENTRLRILPNLPEPDLLELPLPSFSQTEPLVLYFGTLSWQPNIDGALRFLGILPFIRKKMPEARLLVAGKGAPDELRERVEKTDGAEFAGEVEDSEDLYTRARVVVDAAKTGGGTRLKILNALARGVPVVASVEAARGLDIVQNEHLLVARNDHRFADAVLSLLDDPQQWRILSQNGRALIRGRYTSDSAFRPLDDVLARVKRRQ
jgi:glycosyltransferase involved in cell wall biosynthesis